MDVRLFKAAESIETTPSTTRIESQNAAAVNIQESASCSSNRIEISSDFTGLFLVYKNLALTNALILFPLLQNMICKTVKRKNFRAIFSVITDFQILCTTFFFFFF